MIVLRENEYVIRAENYALLHGDALATEGTAGELFREACEAAFGVKLEDLPAAYMEAPESWDNWYEFRSWSAQRGYDVMNSVGRPLKHADYFGYIIEALDLGWVVADQQLMARYAEKLWAARLESGAAEFAKRQRSRAKQRA